MQFGPAAPWDTFVVACWWMLRGAEVLSLKVAQCSVTPGERARAEVRLGCTKMDIEGVGRRRCFLCICPSDAAADGLCPACALSRLLAGASGGPGANAEKTGAGTCGARGQPPRTVQSLESDVGGGAKVRRCRQAG